MKNKLFVSALLVLSNCAVASQEKAQKEKWINYGAYVNQNTQTKVAAKKKDEQVPGGWMIPNPKNKNKWISVAPNSQMNQNLPCKNEHARILKALYRANNIHLYTGKFILPKIYPS